MEAILSSNTSSPAVKDKQILVRTTYYQLEGDQLELLLLYHRIERL